MRLIVAGGRDFNDFDYGFKCIDHMTSNTPKAIITIVCGGAKGADTCGERWYEYNKELGVKIKYFIPDWSNINTPDAIIKTNKFGNKYNARAGIDRNHAMGDFATHLIAFWDGKSKGTKDMINYMKSLDKPCKVFNY